MRLPLIPASDWNRVTRSIERALTRAAGYERETAPRQPWNVQARWNGDRERVEINVRAGYVNAGQVLAPELLWAEAPVATRRRLAERSGEPVEPWLSESPWLPVPAAAVRARAIGGEPERARAWFARWVLDPESEAWQQRPRERRQLRAVELVLIIPRPAVEATVAEGEGTAGPVATGGLLPADAGGVRVALLPEYVPPAEAPTLAEQIASGRVDAPREIRPLATLYFLSPPGVLDPEAPLDATWVAFPAHHRFYDVAFAFAADTRVERGFSLGLSLPLAGGIAQLTVASFLAAWNREDAAAAALLSQSGVRVWVWDV